MIKNNWKKRMTDLSVGNEFSTKSKNYGSLRAMRSKLRLEGFDFTFKLGKRTITVKRIEYEPNNS